jgi:hypothetical protein
MYSPLSREGKVPLGKTERKKKTPSTALGGKAIASTPSATLKNQEKRCPKKTP